MSTMTVRAARYEHTMTINIELVGDLWRKIKDMPEVREDLEKTRVGGEYFTHMADAFEKLMDGRDLYSVNQNLGLTFDSYSTYAMTDDKCRLTFISEISNDEDYRKIEAAFENLHCKLAVLSLDDTKTEECFGRGSVITTKLREDGETYDQSFEVRVWIAGDLSAEQLVPGINERAWVRKNAQARA